ncbi:MAG TPA: twin-arginine translocation signal domain-containing protein [Bryobacteraceae bacterium]|nr:twin-arginine translocation signal domain-containing protein [Bryobacteraceae bacterium]
MTRRRFLRACGAAAALASTSAAQQRKTKNLILVTSDGLRWQDLFNGIDPLLMNQKDAGMTEPGAPELRDRLWKPQAEDRRMALMPYFWGTLAPSGIVLGNVNKGSSVQVTNRYRVSYPGYSEILTGRAQDDVIRGNDPVQNPTPSFLQFVKDQWKLPREKVAVFASWDMFHYIAENHRGEIFINAGYEASTLPADDPLVAELNQLQMQARYLDDSARHDAFTFGLAMEYLKSVQPRVIFISFDETDDWAHDRRYDRVLTSIQFVDGALRELWTWLQASASYRDATTLIVTCDHGRGSTLDDWHSHGEDVKGAEQIWIAAIGPDTPHRGEAANINTYYQRDIAPTALELLGLGAAGYPGMLGKPIDAVLG